MAVIAAEASLQASAAELAAALNLPLASQFADGYEIGLYATPQRLELRDLSDAKTGAVYVDLFSPAVRRRIDAGRRQPFARAFGLHRNQSHRVLDATTGLGRDAAVLAGLGCQVTALERSPVIHAMLAQALEQLRSADISPPWIDNWRELQLAEAAEYFEQGRGRLPSQRHEMVYLDPMFENANRSALPKKELQMLRSLTGDDADADELLAPALDYAGKRVVVKRGAKAPHLAGREPDLILGGARARYDIYLAASQTTPTSPAAA